MAITKYNKDEKLYNFSPYFAKAFSKDIKNIAPFKAIMDQRQKYEEFAFRRPYQYKSYLEMMSKATPLSLVSTIPLRERWFPPYRDVVPAVEEVVVPPAVEEEAVVLEPTRYHPSRHTIYNTLFNNDTCAGHLADISHTENYICGAYGGLKNVGFKWYFKVYFNQVTASYDRSVGITWTGRGWGIGGPDIGGAQDIVGYRQYTGRIYSNGVLVSIVGPIYSGDSVSIAMHIFDAGPDIYIWVAKNDVWLNAGDPVTGANPMVTKLNYATYIPLVPAVTTSGYKAETICFVYDTPPTGFSYWPLADDV